MTRSFSLPSLVCFMHFLLHSLTSHVVSFVSVFRIHIFTNSLSDTYLHFYLSFFFFYLVHHNLRKFIFQSCSFSLSPPFSYTHVYIFLSIIFLYLFFSSSTDNLDIPIAFFTYVSILHVHCLTYTCLYSYSLIFFFACFSLHQLTTFPFPSRPLPALSDTSIVLRTRVTFLVIVIFSLPVALLILCLPSPSRPVVFPPVSPVF